MLDTMLFSARPSRRYASAVQAIWPRVHQRPSVCLPITSRRDVTVISRYCIEMAERIGFRHAGFLPPILPCE